MAYNEGDYRTLASSQSGEVIALVQASATRASGERLLSRVLKLERAKTAPNTMPQRQPLAALPLPPSPDPKPEHHAQEEKEIDENKGGKADPDHGAVEDEVEGIGAAKASAPQVNVANPQTTSGAPSCRENSCRRRILSASSSSARLPELACKKV